MYYFGARYLDPKTSRWMSADPIYDGVKEGFGLYTYCRNNPLVYHDPSGLASAKEYLILSQHVYDGRCVNRTELPENWEVVSDEDLEKLGIDPSILVNEKTGFFSRLYRNTETGEYVYAFRGTDEAKDWVHNFKQAFGVKSEQYEQAIGNTKFIANKVGKDKLSLTGHSLGGGLAAASGTIHGIKATTFNAAGVHKKTLLRHRSSIENAVNYVTAYHLRGDILNRIQDNLGGIIPKAIGNRIVLNPNIGIKPHEAISFFVVGIYYHNAFKMMEGVLK